MQIDALNELHRRTDEVLHYIWDPVRVRGSPAARDEYSGYVADAVAMLMAGASASGLADYLTKIRTDRMGLNPNRAEDEAAVTVLFKWKSKLESARPRVLG